MAIWGDLRARAAASRLYEEQLYAKVVADLQAGIRRDGLWVKALLSVSGNEAAARPIYIKYCVQALKDEAELVRYWADNGPSKDHVQSSKPFVAPERARDSDVVSTSITNPSVSPAEELIEAAVNGDLERCMRLVDRGVDPFKKDSSGFSAADYARGRCHNHVMRYFRGLKKS